MTLSNLVKPCLFLEISAGRTNLGFPKTFLGWYLFIFVECLCNYRPKMRTKYFKNYISILAIVSYWNWLDAS